MIKIECSICRKAINPEEVVQTWHGDSAHSVCEDNEAKADAMEMESIRKAEIRNEEALYGSTNVFLVIG